MKETGIYYLEPDRGGPISSGQRPLELQAQPAHAQDKNPAFSSKSYLSSDEIKRAVDDDKVVRAMVPRENIFGTQRIGEYGNMALRRVRSQMKEEGADEFLQNNPVLACLVPQSDKSAYIATIDGHHRIRVAGAEGIDMIPCEIIDVSLLTDAVNNSGNLEKPITTADLTERLVVNICDAQRSFNFIDPSRQPKPLEGSLTLQDLSEMYQSF